MAKRLKINMRVSAKATKCDIPKEDYTQRWSYSLFGEDWDKEMIYGTIPKPSQTILS